MAWPTKKPPQAPDTSTEGLKRQAADNRQRFRSRPAAARLDALRVIPSIEDCEPTTRRAIEMWADAVPTKDILESTGLHSIQFTALLDSPAARAHYAKVRRRKDTERVNLAAVVPWLEVWQAVKRSRSQP